MNFNLILLLSVAITVLVLHNVDANQDLTDSKLYLSNYYPQSTFANYPRYRYQYQTDDRTIPLDDDYIRSDEHYVEYPPRLSNHMLEKVLTDILEDNADDIQKDEPSDGINKRVLSSFRERVEREKSKEQHEKLAEMFLEKMQQEAEDRDIERDYDNKNYIEMIEDLWEKYKNTHHDKDAPSIYVDAMKKKRQFPLTDYSTLGWSAVGYTKRSSLPAEMPLVDSGNEGLYFLKYPHNDDLYDDNDKQKYDWTKASSQIEYDMQRPDVYGPPYSQEYLYAKRKRYPVAKRSSNFYLNTKPSHHKRGVNKDQYFNKKIAKVESASGTDPNIVKDLSNIFGSKDVKKDNITNNKPSVKMSKNGKNINKKTTASIITVAPAKETLAPIDLKKEKNRPNTSTNLNHKHTEQELRNNQVKEEPLVIKKKSIDWSNYFGIDRRKKNSANYINNNEIDNDWLIKRYNKAVVSAVKRSSDYPLNFFRNHDKKKDSYNIDTETKDDEEPPETTPMPDETKLGDMDDKLKKIEDTIIDEALKYTGAHEGEINPKQIQEVKDKVITRLAAAYNLEKMRRALSEFKNSLAAQKYAMKNKESESDLKDSSGSIKKKSTSEAATQRKCSTKEECDSENYSPPTDNEIEAEEYPSNSNSISTMDSEKCDVIENRCRRLAASGPSFLFYSICKWHQLCYLCGTENDNPDKLTACDVIFVSRADALCQGDIVCQWAARPAVNLLRDLHKANPNQLNGECKRSMCDVSAYSIRRR